MSRRQARENAFKILYSYEVNHVTEHEEAKKLFLEEYPVDSEEAEFFDDLLSGIEKWQGDFDYIIAPRLHNWTLDRVPKIDLTILRIALYERLFSKNVPGDVAISEAVRLAREYSGDAAGQYINAVLGTVDREINALLEADPDLTPANLVLKLRELPSAEKDS